MKVKVFYDPECTKFIPLEVKDSFKQLCTFDPIGESVMWKLHKVAQTALHKQIGKSAEVYCVTNEDGFPMFED